MKIAVIGGGISGLGCAWALSRLHSVVLYETADRLGGHAHTVTVSDSNDEAEADVDVGFIVFNETNYPNLVALFKALGVATENSDMSFSASLGDGALEYEGSLPGLAAQPSNLVKPRYWRMIVDMLRFFREAETLLSEPGAESLSLGDYLRREGYSDSFINDHLLPMGAAIWSAPLPQMLDFPAASFVRFFKNHALLEAGARPAWRTVSGGSKNYVDKLATRFRGEIRLGAPVTSVRPLGSGAEVSCGALSEQFDAVVFACHADQAMTMLPDDGASERRNLLSAFRYQPNRAILHRDPALMPRRRRAWASWNYLSTGRADEDTSVFVTYWMNRLQNIETPEDIFVTLNPDRAIDPALIVGSFDYMHPQFDREAVAAQKALHRVQGRDGYWFCGSYCGNGFHEDGLQAGLQVAAALGSPAPWHGRVVPISPAAGAVAQPIQQAAE
jgi:predicted NAD/FAD-binding protein